MKSPSEFYQKVWQLALQIPEGRVTTYGIICAAAGGHPMMSRMITTILSKSPDVDRIPFHRIVYSNGKIWFNRQSFSDGGRDSIDYRLSLYKKEGIKVDQNNRIIDFEKIVYDFNK